MAKEEKMNEEDQKVFDKIVEASADKVTSQILEPLTEKAVNAISEKIALRKNEIFGNGDDGELKGEAAKKKSAEFIKEWYSKGLTTGGSGSGAELVPTYLADQFIGVAQNYGLVRRKARHWPMEGMNENVPTLDSVTAYRIDTDGNKINTSKPTTGTVNLASKTVGVIVPVSRKLLNNSSIQLVDALSYLAGKAIAKLEDTWGLAGLGAGEGILQNTNVPVFTMASTNTTYAKATAENLLDVIEKVDESFFETANNMSFVMSLGVLNNFRRLRSVVGSDQQGFLFEAFGNPQVPSSMWGIPYDLSPVMPNNTAGSQAGTKFLALVNWDNVLFGDDRQFTMEISNQATITDTDGSTLINLFEQNMVAIKITGDIDIKVANAAKAHAVLKTAAS